MCLLTECKKSEVEKPRKRIVMDSRRDLEDKSKETRYDREIRELLQFKQFLDA